MKTTPLILACFVGLSGMGAAVIAATTPTISVSENADLQTVKGQIKSVDAANDRFVLKMDENTKEMTIRVNDETKYSLNGKQATKEDALKVGATATVVHDKELATRIDSVVKSVPE